MNEQKFQSLPTSGKKESMMSDSAKHRANTDRSGGEMDTLDMIINSPKNTSDESEKTPNAKISKAKDQKIRKEESMCKIGFQIF